MTPKLPRELMQKYLGGEFAEHVFSLIDGRDGKPGDGKADIGGWIADGNARMQRAPKTEFQTLAVEAQGLLGCLAAMRAGPVPADRKAGEQGRKAVRAAGKRWYELLAEQLRSRHEREQYQGLAATFDL